VVVVVLVSTTTTYMHLNSVCQIPMVFPPSKPIIARFLLASASLRIRFLAQKISYSWVGHVCCVIHKIVISGFSRALNVSSPPPFRTFAPKFSSKMIMLAFNVLGLESGYFLSIIHKLSSKILVGLESVEPFGSFFSPKYLNCHPKL